MPTPDACNLETMIPLAPDTYTDVDFGPNTYSSFLGGDVLASLRLGDGTGHGDQLFLLELPLPARGCPTPPIDNTPTT